METPRRSVARRLLTIALGTFVVGALLVAVAATAFWFAMKAERRTTTATVPELVGLPLEDAARVAATDGLEIDVADRRNDPAVASGHIAEQDPPAGAQVRRGRRIRVIESLGGRIVRVPSISGRPSREVGIRLEQDGFAAGDEARAHERLSTPGTVVAQVPAPDSPALPGSRVHRLVSAGPVPVRWVMPDLTGILLARAEDWIEIAGLRRGAVRRIPRDGRVAGVVVGQLPLSGHPVAARGVVELTVAE